MIFDYQAWRGLADRLRRHGVAKLFYAGLIAGACYPNGFAKAARKHGFPFIKARVSPSVAYRMTEGLFRLSSIEVAAICPQLLDELYGSEALNAWFRHIDEPHQRRSQPKPDSSDSRRVFLDSLAVLGLSGIATRAEVDRAFRELSMNYHPDRNYNATAAVQKLAEEKFKAINSAYDAVIGSGWLEKKAESSSTSSPPPDVSGSGQAGAAARSSPDSFPVSPRSENGIEPSGGEESTRRQTPTKRGSNQTAIAATLWSATAITAVVVLGIAFAAVSQQSSYQPKPQGKDDVVLKRKPREKGSVPTGPSQPKKKTERAPLPDVPDPFEKAVNKTAGKPAPGGQPPAAPQFVLSESSLRSAMREASYLIDAGRPSQAAALLRPFTANSRPKYVLASGLWSDFLVLQHKCHWDQGQQFAGRASSDASVRALWETALSKQRLMNHWFDIGMASEAEGVFWEADAAYEYLAERCQSLAASTASNSRTYFLESVKAQRATLHAEREQQLSKVGSR